MANRRTRQVQELASNGIDIGGLASLGFDAQYRDMIASEGDGDAGAQDVDRGGLAIAAAMQCGDVTKMAALLDATPASTSWRERESGAATFANFTIDGAADAQILWHSANLEIPKAADGTLSFSGALRMLAASKTLADVLAVVRTDGTAQSLTYPARLYRATVASFDPGTPIVPVHIESIRLSLSAPIIEDYGDADVAMTAVDRGPWAPLQVSMDFKDSGADEGGNSEIGAALADAAVGDLAVTLSGRGGAADQTLTVYNLLWGGYSRAAGKDHTQFTINGLCGWKNGATTYDLSATPLFSFA